MKFSISLLILVLSCNAFAQNTKLIFDPKRCAADLPNDPRVYSSDFKWNLSLDDIHNLANTMYKSEKRLPQRAYYNESLKSFVFPNENSRGGIIKIPDQFIKTISRHVEKAFERQYIDAVLFPDMGHSHFLIPMAAYKKDMEPLPVNQFNLLYERIFKNKDVKVAYHTAEQLRVMDENKKLIDDKKLQWRYFTRNLVGQNTAEPDIELVNATDSSEANTMSGMNGYYWWGAGFNIHANKDACFAYQKNGQTFYFDLSLQDLESDPSLGDAGNSNN